MSKARFRVHRGMGIKHMRRNKEVRLADRREQSLVARKANLAASKAKKAG